MRSTRVAGPQFGDSGLLPRTTQCVRQLRKYALLFRVKLAFLAKEAGNFVKSAAAFASPAGCCCSFIARLSSICFAFLAEIPHSH